MNTLIRHLQLLITIILSAGVLHCGGDTTSSPPGTSPEMSSGPAGKSDIYGEDDRQEFYELQDPVLREVSTKVALLTQATQVVESNLGGAFRLANRPLGDAANLCRDVPFREQNSGGFCSAFLVAPRLVATAGHCLTEVSDSWDCSDLRVVFDYRYDSAESDPDSINADQVYACRAVLAHRYTSNKRDQPDFALLELDRRVTQAGTDTLRKPLRIASGAIAPRRPVAVLGHPSGLPLKISANGATSEWAAATLFTRTEDYAANFFPFQADIFGGNSGGPIVDAVTGEVLGIMAHTRSRPMDSLYFEVHPTRYWYQYDFENCLRPTVCDEHIRCEGNMALTGDVWRELIPPPLDSEGWVMGEIHDTEPTFSQESFHHFMSDVLLDAEGPIDGVILDVVPPDDPNMKGFLGLMHLPSEEVVALPRYTDNDVDAQYGRLTIDAFDGADAGGPWRLIVGSSAEDGWTADMGFEIQWSLAVHVASS